MSRVPQKMYEIYNKSTGQIYFLRKLETFAFGATGLQKETERQWP
jgi:hypothetical protein